MTLTLKEWTQALKDWPQWKRDVTLTTSQAQRRLTEKEKEKEDDMLQD